MSYSYTSGRLTGYTDLRGKSWTLGYDGNGYLNSIEDPNSHYPMRATYNSVGQVTSEEDANGDSTSYAYSTDDPYDVTTVTPPGRGAYVYRSTRTCWRPRPIRWAMRRDYAYDSEHNVACHHRPARPHHHDAVRRARKPGRRRRARTASYTQKWTYNDAGQVLTYTDGRGKTTTYSYAGCCDSGYQQGELKTVTDPDSNVTTYTYVQPGASAAKVGLIDTIQDARSKTTTFGYDTDGNQNVDHHARRQRDDHDLRRRTGGC